MHITILAIGSRGDVQPYAALGMGLQAAGHQVRIATSPVKDWASTVHVTGYWFLDKPAEFSPPADLVDFLAADKPPIYFGFGSMSDRNPEQVAETVLAALQKTGQ